MAPPRRSEDRGLVVAPLQRDAEALVGILRAHGIEADLSSLSTLTGDLAAGAGFLVLTEEAMAEETVRSLLAWGEGQPDWSSLPVLVLASGASARPAKLRPLLRSRRRTGLSVTPIERPAAPEVLLNAVRTGLESRRQQYHVRDQIAELEEARRQSEILAHEVQHRANNNLARLHAILDQSWRETDDVASFVDRFSTRMFALARSQDLSNAGERSGDLRGIIAVELAVATGNDDRRYSITGVPVALHSQAATTLHLVFHELTTNAVKYGALSNEEGHVSVRWRRESSDGGEALVIEWAEEGGPNVSAPSTRGFGSTLIDDSVVLALGGTVTFDFEPAGLRCVVRLLPDRVTMAGL